MSQDIISDVLNEIMNAKKAKKQELVVNKYSKFLLKILEVAKNHKYILEYKVGKKDVQIKIGGLNECKAIKPRFYVRVNEIEKYVRRYLPARNFGFIIISTNKGLMTHEEAVEKNMGGSLIAYFF